MGAANADPSRNARTEPADLIRPPAAGAAIFVAPAAGGWHRFGSASPFASRRRHFVSTEFRDPQYRRLSGVTGSELARKQQPDGQAIALRSRPLENQSAARLPGW